MSLEWARVRALQDELRLREFVKGSPQGDWVEVHVDVPAKLLACINLPPAPVCASLRGCGVTLLANDYGAHAESVGPDAPRGTARDSRKDAVQAGEHPRTKP